MVFTVLCREKQTCTHIPILMVNFSEDPKCLNRALTNISCTTTTHFTQEEFRKSDIHVSFLTMPAMTAQKQPRPLLQSMKVEQKIRPRLFFPFPMTLGSQNLFLSLLYGSRFMQVQAESGPSLDWHQWDLKHLLFGHLTLSLSFFFLHPPQPGAVTCLLCAPKAETDRLLLQQITEART